MKDWTACRKRAEFLGQRVTRDREIDPGDMHDQVNRSAPAYACFVVEPPASGDDDVMPLGLCAERRSLGLHVESIMREHVSKRGVSNLISELGKVHGLIGNPIERRSSLKVALTSSR